MECVFRVEDYIIDLSRLEKFVYENGFSRLLIEAPQGLIQFLPIISKYVRDCLKGYNVKLFLNLEPSYGLCSVSLHYILSGLADAIIHIGHDFYPYPLCIPNCSTGSKLLKERVLLVPAEYAVNEHVAAKLAKLLARKIGEGHSVSLGYTTQHRKLVNILATQLERLNINVKSLSQILGCYTLGLTRSKSDFYAIVAGGYFHALGVALAIGDGSRVLRADPYEAKVESIEGIYRKTLAKRYWAVMRLRNAKTLGVIVGTLPGQYRPGIVDAVVKLLDKYGIKYELFYVERLTQEYLDNLKPSSFDGFVITSCPRLAIDDLGDYWKPVVTPGELTMALRGISRYIFPW
jgi:2-(3-amino-3-carboxypropyl)histidine synthase